MRNPFLHRIIGLTMMFSILLSSTGFAMDMHFCKQELKKITLFGSAESCQEEQEPMACHEKEETLPVKSESCHRNMAEKTVTHSDDCCQNKSLVIEKSDKELAISQVITDQDIQLDAVVAFIASYIFYYKIDIDYPSYTHYKPPLPDRDIQVLFQTFLI